MELNAFYLDHSDDASADLDARMQRIAPMLARFTTDGFGHVLHLSPIHATDVTRRWSAICGSAVAGTVLIDDPAADDGRLAPLSDVPEDPTQLTAASLTAFVERLGLGHAVAVVVDGPVDHRDVAAMERALRAGQSPLQAELRAEAALRVVAPRTIELHLRHRVQAGPVIGEALRQFVAAMRRTNAEAIALPTDGLLYDMVHASDFLELRPCETESHSSAMDITLRVDEKGHTASLVYDLIANSWHGD